MNFSSVLTKEQNNLPEFDNFMQDKLNNIFCDANEVEHRLKELNAHKSQGPDLISPRILKECAREQAISEFPCTSVQSESKCETILMKMTLICMKMKLYVELIFI